ncbi:hypothetical protein VF21_08315 [Pseudogymnoascus sp. 05NY08]|nr:hypothetical protein VF21_08315 [Pseudogymnoascus sp. 05NY08]
MTRVSFRYILVGVPLLCVYLTACYLNIHNRGLGARIRKVVEDHDLVEPLELPRHPLLKPNLTEIDPPVVDNFPLAQAAASARELPPIPSWNAPPRPHVPEKTPLFIGFTRNWRILQQAVVAYITAGWPPEDIYVIENTGTMDANEHGKLSLQNPFFLNHTRLQMLGVNILTTPTLLTFSQLQNFFLYVSLKEHWPQYYWSHMDVGVASFEDEEPFDSLYMRAVYALRNTTVPDYGRWAQVLFSYDRLALVNTAAYTEVGAWDTQIPYYLTDCDMHERLAMAGFRVDEKKIGQINDVGTSISDLLSLYRKQVGPLASFVDPNPPEAYDIDKKGSKTKRGKSTDSIWPEYTRGDESYRAIVRTFEGMDHSKYRSPKGRNIWQHRQTGGQGEPYYRDPVGFETALWMTIDHGRLIYAEKWGHRDCNLREVGLRPEHAWMVEKDWEYREKHPEYVDPKK